MRTILQRSRGQDGKLFPVREDLRRHGIRTVERKGFDSDVVWDASIQRQLLLLPACLRDVVFDMAVKPLDWGHEISYGFFYREDLSGVALSFMEFVRSCHRLHPEITHRLTVFS